MILETMLAMSFITAIAMASVGIISTNIARINDLKERYELLSELKKHLTLRLLNPELKEHNDLLFQKPALVISTKTTGIQQRSSLHKYAESLKLLHVSGYKTGDKTHPMTITGFIIASEKQEPK